MEITDGKANVRGDVRKITGQNWSYDPATHKLSITGKIPVATNYSQQLEMGVGLYQPGYYMWRNEIQTVEISNVDTIPDSAFTDCINITKITADKTISDINDDAFHFTNFKKLSLPSGVTPTNSVFANGNDYYVKSGETMELNFESAEGIVTIDGNKFNINSDKKVTFTMPNTNLSIAAEDVVFIPAIEGLTYNKDEKYYEIGSAENLKALANYVAQKNNCRFLTFKLTEDINMENVTDFSGIGDDLTKFAGTFDGNGKISAENILINGTGENDGFGLAGGSNADDILIGNITLDAGIFEAYGSDGADKFTISNLSIGGGNFLVYADNDDQSGNDNISVDGANIGTNGRLELYGGNGNDSITVKNITNGNFAGIDGGSGNDTISVDDSTVYIDGGEGSDTIIIGTSTAQSADLNEEILNLQGGSYPTIAADSSDVITVKQDYGAIIKFNGKDYEIHSAAGDIIFQNSAITFGEGTFTLNGTAYNYEGGLLS